MNTIGIQLSNADLARLERAAARECRSVPGQALWFVLRGLRRPPAEAARAAGSPPSAQDAQDAAGRAAAYLHSHTDDTVQPLNASSFCRLLGLTANAANVGTVRAVLEATLGRSRRIRSLQNAWNVPAAPTPRPVPRTGPIRRRVPAHPGLPAEPANAAPELHDDWPLEGLDLASALDARQGLLKAPSATNPIAPRRAVTTSKSRR